MTTLHKIYRLLFGGDNVEETSPEYRRNYRYDVMYEKISMEESEDESIDSENTNLEIDTEDTIVSTIDGVLVMVDEEEVRMLFFYAKPLCNHNGGPIKFKGVAELRLTPTAFRNILRQMNKAAETSGYVTLGEENLNSYKPMFA